ncbi:3-hydroxyacyl-CoA dehydrogenase family protein [Bacillus dakarensis]|uniref:3-hydroxyacyl-CoA dehydrogenase family protein n=1 Tax=Robertmurraya dakarensis TaxID=1926278 RepID=UPI0009826935|nr:3-hydroxyacyl-CoA dehydrogenase family protein [Bacillus dakarensis]
MNKRTTAITIDDIEFVKFNEAAKLVEEGVSNVKDINLAMTLANGEPEGPFQVAQRYELNEVINRLEYLSEKLGKEILRPTSLLLEESS